MVPGMPETDTFGLSTILTWVSWEARDRTKSQGLGKEEDRWGQKHAAHTLYQRGNFSAKQLEGQLEHTHSNIAQPVGCSRCFKIWFCTKCFNRGTSRNIAQIPCDANAWTKPASKWWVGIPQCYKEKIAQARLTKGLRWPSAFLLKRPNGALAKMQTKGPKSETNKWVSLGDKDICQLTRWLKAWAKVQVLGFEKRQGKMNENPTVNTWNGSEISPRKVLNLTLALTAKGPEGTNGIFKTFLFGKLTLTVSNKGDGSFWKRLNILCVQELLLSGQECRSLAKSF